MRNYAAYKLVRILLALGITVFAAIATSAQTFTTVASFDGANGAYPISSLVQGFDGNLYGTTQGGGAHGNGDYNSGGAVFKMSPQGKLTALYSFCAEANCTDGTYPQAGLVLTPSANFYGTTAAGGTYGGGTFFKITASGKLTTIYNFCHLSVCPPGSDALNGPGAVIQGTDGNFYGTAGGGANGYGAIFKITPEGALTTLHSFCAQAGCTDGASPNSPLVEGTDGNFYGTTLNSPPYSYGTIFKITPGGTLTTLWSFVGSDGLNPGTGLIQGTNGNFYGTTLGGGYPFPGCYTSSTPPGCGTVFEITPEGVLNSILDFAGNNGGIEATNAGEEPDAPLIQATDGNFYGTTLSGGTIACPFPGGCGTVYGVDSGVLYSFCAQAPCPDNNANYNFYAGLVQATNGNLYGTTFTGGLVSCFGGGCGTVYSMSLGLAPFVSFIGSSGHVGQAVQILGQGFKGATGVSFNGIPTTFTAKSDTYLAAIVPVGATNGSVTVTEPSGTLKSNKTFLVTPNVESFAPSSGPVGTPVVITGNSFTGATTVTFDCKWQASFTVDSDTQITAIVPPNATVGTITVRTAGGTYESTQTFTVTP
jgi:uncharacterized repeat protein (TIGR03803 family)